MSLEREPATPAHTRERLNGWKDIANHLGKGVRTAQRWEREYGLPVHRLGRDGGEIIFAFSDELDAWLARSEKVRQESRNGTNGQGTNGQGSVDPVPLDSGAHAEPGRGANGHPPPTAAPTGIDVPRHRVTILRRWAPLTLLLAALFAVALFLVTRGAPVGGTDARSPAAIEFRDNTLVILDERRELLWTKRLAASTVDRIDPRHPRRLAHLIDLEGDGRPEVVLKAPEAAGPTSTVEVFNADGSHRFTHRLDQTVHYGPNTHGPRWFSHQTFLVAPPSGPSELWVSFIPPHEFPTRLDHLDAHGRVLSIYWSNGYIEWVGLASVASKDVLMVGATNNDLRGASLAVFDRTTVRGSAPAENDAYRCLDCGEGSPDVFLVFPRPCFTRAEGGQPVGTRATVHGDGRITVLVEHQTGGARPASVPAQSHVYYEFDDNFDLRSIEVGAAFLPQHAYYERDRVIDHPLGQSDLDDLSIVRRWDGTRFVTLPRVPIRVAGLGPDSR
jgi:hypothetical protein